MVITDNPHHRFTVVVCGTEFSGSSLVAGTLRILGIPMGRRFHPENTHQDADFCAPHWGQPLLDAIRKRNSRYSVWGFKWLALHLYLRPAIEHIINPVFIYCHRDVKGCLTSGSPYRMDSLDHLSKHVHEVEFLMSLFKRIDPPLLVVDFNSSKEELLREIAEFVHITPTTEQVDRYNLFNNQGIGYSKLD